MKEISSSDFELEVLSQSACVVDFYSTECPPCEAVAPKFESLHNLYGEHVHFVKIFRQGNKELATKLGVSSSPTLLFYKNGVRLGDQLSGGVKKSDIIKNLDLLITPDEVVKIKSGMKPSNTSHDVVILGAGPAALAAGIYLAQAKTDTLIIDTALPGGQVSTTHQVSNYPGFEEPIQGYMLGHHMSEQAKKAGVKFKVAVDVSHVDLIKKEIVIDEFETIKAKTIIIATGASPRKLNIPGEKEFKGKGLSYCATCDAKYFQDKEVIVIGGGNSAVEESDFIARFASKITMVHQFDTLTANKEAQEKILNNPKVKVLFQHEPRAFAKEGDKMVVTIEDLLTHETKKIAADGVFIFVGMSPNLDIFKEDLQKDKWGYILTDEDMHTNIKGVFAIGDVISKKYRQITTAVADGTIASIVIAKELG